MEGVVRSVDGVPAPGRLWPDASPVLREVSQLARSIPGAVRLHVGQPDLTQPEHVAEAGIRAIRDGRTGYPPMAGLPEVRELVAERLRRERGIPVDAGQVLMTPGGVGALAAALTAILSPGDEVLVPDPGWPPYRLMAACAGARAVAYPLPAAAGFQPDLARLEGAITPRTRALLVNSPSNPAGAVLPDEAVEALVDLALRHDLWIVSDECYDRITFGPPGRSPASLPAGARVITVGSFSKTYAMTGWRLGYAAAGRAAIRAMTRVVEASSSGPSIVSQVAGAAALAGPQDCVDLAVATYRRRRDVAVDLLRRHGLLVSRPEGAFYVLAGVAGLGLPSRDLALRLLRERRVAVAPGGAFGLLSEGTVRLSLASREDELVAGIGELAALAGELRTR